MIKIFHKIILILLIGLLPFHAFADDHSGNNVKPDDLLHVQSIKMNKGETIYLVITKDGHSIGNPFLVEVRPTCGADKTWEDLEVRDMESACDVYLDTVQVNKSKTKVSIMVGKIDNIDRAKQAQKDPDNIKPKCVRGKIIEFKLKGICEE